MELAQLKQVLANEMKKLDELDRAGLLTAPVDLEHMFWRGIDERASLEGESVSLNGEQGVVVTGSVNVGRLVATTHVLVMGDVRATSISITGSLLVLGTLTADELRGHDERYSGTVVGTVTIGRAIMVQQYMMNFLGGGTIDELIDEEGGGQELIDLMSEAGSKLDVKKISSRVPVEGIDIGSPAAERHIRDRARDEVTGC